jgi:P27 family predicted phage terminase small subunit
MQKQIRQHLQEYGLLTEIDEKIIEQAAKWFAVFDEAERGIKEQGLVTETGNGTLMLSPYFKAMEVAQKNLLLLSNRLGLDPLSRSKMATMTARKMEDDIFSQHAAE